ncbi:bifunctional glycosyltransferase/CDP-glycerol:glycerophosphate glycerophosphotransferase [Streptomyces anandii]|uniref:bifunctional glycosyltransferase/CDP-glycerol:glycerophosphate glycerophosphotransferase n=1 Tax=Streptomyces anandii TaxID=285454 RepID=UPI001672320B|nr:bifunctional glycosyltransferase family 2 protein/CDP-glycerol:glycerophosphate glycerophosphotransferase [Streptomyces anandii]GGY07433.1 glycosyl transferase family A [Streptomyces anandii JCM 4720]
MPRFSIIVPSHGVVGRLSLALDSVLAQSFGDFELIPVCDAPGAPGADVAAGYAGRDARVAPVHSSPAAGPGAARNAGMRAATGTYLLFLDGDDMLAPGALAALDARLAKTGDVDVLYFEHERTPWWEGAPANPAAELLAGAPAHAFSPEQAPWLTGVRLPVWSAAYRRSFLTGHQLAFPGGHWTGLGWSGLVTVAAGRVAVLRRVVVRHLLRRQGSRLHQPGEHQFDLLEQGERVLVRAAAAGLSEGRYAALFTQVLDVVLDTAAHPGRLPAGRCRAFLRRARRLYRRHRPAGFRMPGGRPGARLRLLAAGAYTAFRALCAGDRAAVRAAGRLPRGRRLRARLTYRWHLCRPLEEDLVVYCAYWGRGYACSPAALHAKARELAPHLRGVFLVEPGQEHTVPPDVDHAVIGSPRYWRVLARAKYLVNNANFADAVVKRPGSVHLQTQHGTPLKTMGCDQSTYPVVAAATGSFTKLLARVDRWDYNLSSNRHSTEMWERAFPGGYEPLEYGYPRNDVYLTAGPEDVARVRRELGVPEGSTAVLYAPTHRDHHTGFETGLDLEAFCAAAGEDVVVLLRAHYFYDRGDLRGTSGRVIDVTAHRSSEDVCLAADALVTDYSSIMFDYAVLDRPIVVLADDWEVYRETRGVYFDLMETPPGPVVRTPHELARLFRDGSWAGARSAALRAAFRERFCQFDDGRAAERVVRRVFLGEPPEALPPVIPLAERAPAPAAATSVRS